MNGINHHPFLSKSLSSSFSSLTSSSSPSSVSAVIVIIVATTIIIVAIIVLITSQLLPEVLSHESPHRQDQDLEAPEFIWFQHQLQSLTHSAVWSFWSQHQHSFNHWGLNQHDQFDYFAQHQHWNWHQHQHLNLKHGSHLLANKGDRLEHRSERKLKFYKFEKISKL